jgi:N-acetylmuramoyl-L-alanine amidase
LGNYADRPNVNSPNNCTIGIELCTLDSIGNFLPETLTAAAELVAKLLRDNKLGIDDAATHHMVVGWKDCPRLWTNNPAKFEAFKERVKAYFV